ncbi:hypothetical protein GCM10007159_07350 [Modicisalibacter luteus]|nr:hypothetical protein GCM10007159_07350 [Halomonas lutea]
MVEKQRLTLSMVIDDWWRQVVSIRLVAFEATTAVKSTRLPGESHKAPADRVTVALARYCHGNLRIHTDSEIECCACVC